MFHRYLMTAILALPMWVGAFALAAAVLSLDAPPERDSAPSSDARLLSSWNPDQPLDRYRRLVSEGELDPRCFPESPIQDVPQHVAWRWGKDNNIRGNQTAPAGLEVDLDLHAVSRDILRNSVRRVDMWGTSGPISAVCKDRPGWLSFGNAIALQDIEVQTGSYRTLWVTTDHIAWPNEYLRASPQTPNFNAITVNGYQITRLPRRPDEGVAFFTTPKLYDVTPFCYWHKAFGDGSKCVAEAEDVFVGQRIYVPFSHIQTSCWPNERNPWAPDWDCIHENGVTNTGWIAGTTKTYGKMGGQVQTQTDIRGGASGGPVLIKVDDGNELTNARDFALVSVNNTGTPDGSGNTQVVTREMVERAIRWAESQGSPWQD